MDDCALDKFNILSVLLALRAFDYDQKERVFEYEPTSRSLVDTHPEIVGLDSQKVPWIFAV